MFYQLFGQEISNKEYEMRKFFIKHYAKKSTINVDQLLQHQDIYLHRKQNQSQENPYLIPFF